MLLIFNPSAPLLQVQLDVESNLSNLQSDVDENHQESVTVWHEPLFRTLLNFS